MLGVKNIQFVQVYAMVREVTIRRGYGPEVTNEITIEVCLRVWHEINNSKKQLENKDIMSRAYGLVIEYLNEYNKTQKQEDLDDDDINWLIDERELAARKMLNNQVDCCVAFIDEYVSAHPGFFTDANKMLWELIKEKKHTVADIMTSMQFDRAQLLYEAEVELLQRIIAIYDERTPSNPK